MMNVRKILDTTGDRLSAGSGTDVRTAAAVVASCAARKRRNNRD